MDERFIPMGQLVANGEMERMCWEDDELALRMSASQGRHPWNEMTSLERRCFHDIAINKDHLKIYLFIRNKILQHWHLEPNVEVTWENVVAHLAEPYNNKRELVRRTLLYLTRYGYINYGCFHRLTAVPRAKKRKQVVVIGGGMAGVAAARQLDSFGFDVVLLEASNRLGGRVLTKRLVNSLADGIKPKTKLSFGAELGGESIRGCHGNPFMPLIKQLSCTPVQLSSRIPLYDETGKYIDSQRVDLIKAKFMNMSTAVLYLVNVKNVTAVDGEPLDLKSTFEQILEHCEMSNLKREERYWENYHELVGKVDQTMLEISELNESGRLLEKKASDLEKMKAEGRLTDIEAELVSRFLYVDMNRFNKLYDAARERRATLTALLKDIKKNEPSDCFMNENDKRVLDWFLAYLEGCVGACLDELPIEFYNPAVVDGHKEFNMGLKEGFGPIVTRLAAIDKVQTNARVTAIQYNEDKVVVDFCRTTTKMAGNEELVETVNDRISADAVVCTVPLGILKKDVIQFDPPLPESKREAIQKMGFGVINKIVLVFEKTFWNTEQSFFGHLNPWGSSRGEYFLFTSVGTKPVLSVIMAGHAALCEQPKEVIINGAMTVLKNIFGTSSTPKEPKEAFVTKWQCDKNFYGSHSFVQKGTNYEMYDILAEPLAGPSSDSTLPGISRVFFAGEHTYRSDPATLQGAFLSGMRAAAEVADQLIGQPFLKNFNNDYISLSDDDEVSESSFMQKLLQENTAMNEIITTSAANDDDDIQILQ